jgi:hypothetical protein
MASAKAQQSRGFVHNFDGVSSGFTKRCIKPKARLDFSGCRCQSDAPKTP